MLLWQLRGSQRCLACAALRPEACLSEQLVQVLLPPAAERHKSLCALCCTRQWHLQRQRPYGVRQQPAVSYPDAAGHFCRSAAALHAWHQVVKQSKSLHQISSSLAVQLQQRSMQRCLQAWQIHCLQKQTHRRLLVRLCRTKAQSRLNSTFQAWRSYVANFRYRTCQTASTTAKLMNAH